MSQLIFKKGNAKLAKNIYTFSLPAGYSCPFAHDCLSKANPQTGKLTDGPNTKFRCFAASSEAVFPNVREARWNNFDFLKGKGKNTMMKIITASLPKDAEMIRIHVSGDFFNEAYFTAWVEIASDNPNIMFYAYTKSLKYWVKYMYMIPFNLKLTASEGGKDDHLIKEHKLKYAKVVFSPEEAEDLGLEIDHDDSHAYSGNKSFALLLHGTQPKGSEAAKALSKMKREGVEYAYSK